MTEPARNSQTVPSGQLRPEPRASYGKCQRCPRREQRGYITTSSGRLLVCLSCYVDFTNLPSDHPARP